MTQAMTEDDGERRRNKFKVERMGGREGGREVERKTNGGGGEEEEEEKRRKEVNEDKYIKTE